MKSETQFTPFLAYNVQLRAMPLFMVGLENGYHGRECADTVSCSSQQEIQSPR